MQSLQLNIIPFTTPVKEITLPFYIGRREGFYGLFLDDEVKELVGDKMTTLELLENRWIYTDFGTPKDEAFVLTINVEKNPKIALHYFKHLLYEYFRNGVAHIMQRNYIDDIEVWFLNPEEVRPTYNIFDKFTLKVNHCDVTTGFELVVSYDGTSRVSKKSLKEMPNFNTNNLHLVNSNGTVRSWKHIPPQDKLYLDKIYPIIGEKLYQTYSITYELPDNKNRYPRYFKPITNFYETYLNNNAFRKVLPIDKNGFISNYTATAKRLSEVSNKLKFGKSTGVEPKTDLKKHGPCAPVPPPNNVTFFFIYHKDSQEEYNLLKKYFEEGYKGHPNLQDFIYQPFYIDESLNIVLSDISNAINEVYAVLKDRIKQPDTKHFAIYISPIAKYDKNPDNRGIYYRMKEMFLYCGYYSQVIYKGNIRKYDFKTKQFKQNEYFNIFLPNIQAAILAKLGGIPWRLDRVDDDELIIGVGAFNSITKKSKYVGSAFCFDNTGRFKNFACFGKDDTKALAGSIREAVISFHEQKPKATRIIIHFYKVISKKEIKPILDTIYNGLKLPIPIIVVTINKTVSKELLAFDTLDQKNLMPYSGTYIKMAERQYLLFNNTRYKSDSKVADKEYHFPVKIKLTSTHLELLEDESLIDLLIDQVYQFSRMYWKSVSQQNIPVTISYPEMVAQMFPYFKQPQIPEFGTDKLWFL
ncbi:MAG: Piwi domain-containing protein [Bacteroidota bacterium]